MDDQFTPSAPDQPGIVPSPFQSSMEPVMPPNPEAPVASITNQNPKTKRSKKPLIISILVIILVAGAGYGVYAWQHKKVNDQNSQITSLQGQVSDLNNQVSSLKSSSSSSSSANTPTTSYKNTVKISELGIFVAVPDSLKDLTYVVTSQSPVDGHQSISVGLTTQALLSEDKSCTAAKGAIGQLSKTNGQYPTSANASNSSGELLAQYSDYYMAYSSPQGACGSSADTSSTQSEDVAILRSLDWPMIIKPTQ